MLPVFFALLAAPFALAAPRGIVGFYDPTSQGGSWLDNAGDGYGEPMNVSRVAYPHDVCLMRFLHLYS